MKVPDSFPSGCKFFASFSGDEYAVFPDGAVFKLADSGEELMERKALPSSGAAPMSESAFLSCAAGNRAFAAANASPKPEQ